MNEHRSVTEGATSSSSQNPRRNDEGEPPAKKSSKELRLRTKNMVTSGSLCSTCTVNRILSEDCVYTFSVQ